MGRRNGDIAAQQWATAQVPDITVDYGYDFLHRITSSNYSQNGLYNTSYEYDIRGNVLSLMRSGADESGNA